MVASTSNSGVSYPTPSDGLSVMKFNYLGKYLSRINAQLRMKAIMELYEAVRIESYVLLRILLYITTPILIRTSSKHTREPIQSSL
jgi:hypothetical protein